MVHRSETRIRAASRPDRVHSAPHGKLTLMFLFLCRRGTLPVEMRALGLMATPTQEVWCICPPYDQQCSHDDGTTEKEEWLSHISSLSIHLLSRLRAIRLSVRSCCMVSMRLFTCHHMVPKNANSAMIERTVLPVHIFLLVDFQAANNTESGWLLGGAFLFKQGPHQVFHRFPHSALLIQNSKDHAMIMCLYDSGQISPMSRYGPARDRPVYSKYGGRFFSASAQKGAMPVYGPCCRFKALKISCGKSIALPPSLSPC